LVRVPILVEKFPRAFVKKPLANAASPKALVSFPVAVEYNPILSLSQLLI
jgi:hypothetical protein